MDLRKKLMVALGISLFGFPIFIGGIVLHFNTIESVDHDEFTMTEGGVYEYTFENIEEGTLNIDFYSATYRAIITVKDPNGDEIFKEILSDENSYCFTSVGLDENINITEKGDHTIIYEGPEIGTKPGFLTSDHFDMSYKPVNHVLIGIGTFLTIFFINTIALAFACLAVTIELVLWVKRRVRK